MGNTAQVTALSVGVSAGKVTEEHTRRVYCPYSADPALSDRNVHVVDPHWDDSDHDDPIISYRDQVNYIFEESILEYNQRQKRKDRKKDPYGYYDELIREGSQITPVYSYVIQFGNRDICGTCDETFDYEYYKGLAPNERSHYALEHANNSEIHDTCVDMLTRIGEEFHDRYPHLEVLAAVIHDDEPCGTPHLTIDVCPVATGYKRGMRERCGMSRALAQMGFETGDKHSPHHYSIVNFQNDIKDWIENEIMADEGLSRRYMNNNEPHRDVHEFAAWKRQQEKEQSQAEAEVNAADIQPEYTKKNVAEELDTIPDVTANEALSIDLSAQIQTQQAQLAALKEEREREEDERAQRKAKHAKIIQEQQDELDRLRQEATRLREEIADGRRIMERLTKPLASFADWFCARCKPATRDAWRDRFDRWIGAYERDLSREFNVDVTQDAKPAPEWHGRGSTYGGQYQTGHYLR